MKGRGAGAGTVDDVNFVAFFDEKRRPAATAIGSAHPVRALSAAAVDQHDRIRMADPRRGLILHVHLLTVDHGAASQVGPLHAHPEVAPLGDVEGWSASGSGLALWFGRLPVQLTA